MSPYTSRQQAAGFAICFLATLLAAGAGAIASVEAQAFYAQLERPYWAPPAQVFGPVWSVLYLAMAVAAWLVWRRHDTPSRRRGLFLFALQLVLNALWSWLFFAWQWGAAALVDITLLWLLVAATMANFWRVRAAAGFLMVPYLFWVSFAAVLNLALWRLNPDLLS